MRLEGLVTKDQVRAFYEQIAPDISRLRRKNAYYYELLAGLLRSLVPPGKRILDVGCGQGELLNALQPCYGVGIDLSPSMIVSAKSRFPHLLFSVGDAESLDLRDGPFDYIILSNTVGYLQDIQKAFHRLRPYTAPHTRVVITHYNHLWEPVLKLAEWLGLKMREPYQNWLSIGDLESLLRLEGFEVVKSRKSILVPKRIPLVSRWCNRYLSQFPLLGRLALMQTLVARPAQAERSEAYSCTVVIPARNERGNIGSLIRGIPDMGRFTELIFVEGHSQDGTLDEIRREAKAHPERDIKVLTQDGEGKGDAVRKGFAHARGDILMILDADLTVEPRELTKFFDAVASGKAELAIGCRLVYRRQKDSMRLLNLAGNKFFSLVFSYLLDQRIKDTLCGTKALLKRDYEQIKDNRAYFGDLDPFGDFDLLFGAAKQNLRIREIPVRYRARVYGNSNIRRFKHGLLLLRMSVTGLRKLRMGG